MKTPLVSCLTVGSERIAVSVSAGLSRCVLLRYGESTQQSKQPSWSGNRKRRSTASWISTVNARLLSKALELKCWLVSVAAARSKIVRVTTSVNKAIDLSKAVRVTTSVSEAIDVSKAVRVTPSVNEAIHLSKTVRITSSVSKARDTSSALRVQGQ